MDTRTGDLYELRPGESMADLQKRLGVAQEEFDKHFVEMAGETNAIAAVSAAMKAHRAEQQKRRAQERAQELRRARAKAARASRRRNRR